MKSFIYRIKKKKLKNKSYSIAIVLSAIIIASCLFIKSESIYAYFSSMASCYSEEIVFADYEIKVSVDNNTLQKNIYTFTSNGKKKFELKASETSATGYCKINISGKNYYTDQIAPGDTIYITIEGSNGQTVEFTAHWGRSENYESGSVSVSAENDIIYYSSGNNKGHVNKLQDNIESNEILEGASSIVEEDGVIKTPTPSKPLSEDTVSDDSTYDNKSEESSNDTKIESSKPGENNTEISDTTNKKDEEASIDTNIEEAESEDNKEVLDNTDEDSEEDADKASEDIESDSDIDVIIEENSL